MKFTQLHILNFRSIQEITIDISYNCNILVGINESGKSNILKALSLISNNVPINSSDKREPLPLEKPYSNAFVDFIFEFTTEETKEIYEKLKEKILSKDYNIPIIQIKRNKYSLLEFCSYRPEGIYSVNLMKGKKYGTMWTLPSGSKIESGWKVLKSGSDVVLASDEEFSTVKPYVIVHQSCIPSKFQSHYEDLTPERLNLLYGACVRSMVNENLPSVVFWEFDPSNILPSSVEIAVFSADPSSCTPLENMFHLAGYSDVKQSIDNAIAKSATGLRNLLNQVATQTTEYIHSIWKEYKNVHFSLFPNGDKIEITLKENTYYSFSQRSDGFKRFVSFLLLISSAVRNNKIENSLILIDEPDNSLHPSGIKYLRDELIRISEKNYVFISTHSIFMVDSNNIERHLIVKKIDEKTETTVAYEDNIKDEEVIYKALGYSVMEALSEFTILFEGWRDKKLFEMAISHHPDDIIKKKMQSIGFSHSNGVKEIGTFASFFEVAKRKLIIISDSDNPAKEKEKHHKQNNGYGSWYRYDQLVGKPKVYTSEDFVTQDLIDRAIEDVKLQYKDLRIDFVPSSKSVCNDVQHWIAKNGLSGHDAKNCLNVFKTYVANNLTPNSIKEDYYKLISNLYKKLK